MSDKRPATENELSALHAELAGALAKAIKPKPILDSEGEVIGHETSPAALNVARQFLKDNNITAALVPKSPLANLVEGMPDFGDESSAFQPGQKLQ